MDDGTGLAEALQRRWRCVDADCDAKTWTEHSDHVDAQAVLTRRAGAEACRQVGEEARPVSRVAADWACAGGRDERRHRARHAVGG